EGRGAGARRGGVGLDPFGGCHRRAGGGRLPGHGPGLRDTDQVGEARDRVGRRGGSPRGGPGAGVRDRRAGPGPAARGGGGGPPQGLRPPGAGDRGRPGGGGPRVQGGLVMNELEVIARLVPHLATRGGDLVIGAGEDDAAAWREEDGTFTVAT